MAVSEFAIVALKLSAETFNVQNQNICGIEYLTFQSETELNDADIAIISDLSFIYALFRLENNTFTPIERKSAAYVDESIGMILKYVGKTNEIFTRMMINVAFSSIKHTGNVRLLDPLSGKGTTLYEGLIKGYDVYGIEIGEKITTEAYHFVQKFLESAKYKFDLKILRQSGEGKTNTAVRHTFTISRNKEEYKNGQIKTVELMSGNSQFADKYYKKNFFDIIVGDLPYGVQHGSVTNEKQTSMTRNPTELLESCLPAWIKILRPGGVIVLAWNSNMIARRKMTEIIADSGLAVMNDGAYGKFEHRVDQAIVRDIIVAKKI